MRKASGLRIGVLIVDEKAWVFSPTPEIIFDQPDRSTLNAVEVSSDFAQQILVSVAPELSVSEDGIPSGVLPDSTEPELGTVSVTNHDVTRIEEELKKAPPQKFDHTRKVRVYQSYLQFVDIRLEKGSLQTHRISIPQSLLRIVEDTEVRERMTASYRLLDRNSELATELEGVKRAVDLLREDFTQSVGQKLGRVLARADKEEFSKRVEDIKATIDSAKIDLEDRLTSEIKDNCQRLAMALAPDLAAKPPKGFQFALGQRASNIEDVKKFLERELMPSKVRIASLVTGMELEIVFKDITFEMLNDRDFIDRLKELFPELSDIHTESDALSEKENTGGTA